MDGPTRKAEHKQYEIQFPSEYTESIVNEIADLMGIHADLNEVKSAMTNDGSEPTEESYCLFQNRNDEQSFILLDCLNNDFLYSIVVRCRTEIHEQVWSSLFKWDTYARKKYRQEIRVYLEDTREDSTSDFHQIVSVYKLNI